MTAALALLAGILIGTVLGLRAAITNQRIDALIADDTHAAFVDDAADIAMDDAL